MTLREENGRWLCRKTSHAKRLEDVTDIIVFDGDFCSIMGKAGLTEFHSYLGKKGNHWKQMRGVTSVLNKWGEKEKLMQWAVMQAIECVKAKGEEAVPGLWYVSAGHLEQASKAHKTALNDASDWGKAVHLEIEGYIKAAIAHGGKLTAVPGGISESATAFVKWAIEEDVQFLASEKVVYSRDLWLAGTLDAVGIINGRRFIIDLKTTNWVSPKQFLQCGAYALLEKEPVDAFMIVHLPRSGGLKTWTNEEVGAPVDKLKNGYLSLLQLDELDDVISSNLYV